MLPVELYEKWYKPYHDKKHKHACKKKCSCRSQFVRDYTQMMEELTPELRKGNYLIDCLTQWQKENA
jgi:hypothetical protein